MNFKAKSILTALVFFGSVATLSGCATFEAVFDGDSENQTDFSIQLAEAEATYATLLEVAITLVENGQLSLKRAESIDVIIEVAGGTLDRVNEAYRDDRIGEARGHYAALEALLLELSILVSKEVSDNQNSEEV